MFFKSVMGIKCYFINLGDEWGVMIGIKGLEWRGEEIIFYIENYNNKFEYFWIECNIVV